MNSTKSTTRSKRRVRSDQIHVVQLNDKILATIRIRRPGEIEIELTPEVQDVAAVYDKIKYRLLEAAHDPSWQNSMTNLALRRKGVSGK
jgi:hypothetical protein